MSLTIAIPIKLRIDARAARDERERIDALVRTALERVAESAVRELADRGDYLLLDLQECVVRWKGPGLRDVTGKDRKDLQEAIATAIRETMPRALHRPSSDPPEVLPEGAGAPRDPGQTLPGVYVVQSYDGDPADKRTPRNQVVYAESKEWLEREFPFDYGLYQYTSDAELLAAIRAIFAVVRGRKRAPPKNLVGFLYRGPGPSGETVKLALTRVGTTGVLRVLRSIVIGRKVVVEATDGNPRPQDYGHIVWGESELRREKANGTLESEIVARLLGSYEEGIARIIAEKQLSPREQEDLRAAFKTKTLDAVQAGIALSASENPDSRLVLASYGVAGAPKTLFGFPDIFEDQDSIPVYAITSVFPFATEEPGEGEAASSGRRGDGGDGAAEGGGDGGEGGDASEGVPEISFPSVNTGGETIQLDLGPLNDEVSLDDLGAAGDRMRELMRRIAWRLNMPMGKYPGSFLVAAAEVWGGRAAGASGFAGAASAGLRRVEGSSGALGDVDFVPAPSPVLDAIRHLGATTPIMTALENALLATYHDDAHAAKLGGYYTGRGTNWNLHFLMEYTPRIHYAIGYGFKVACQSCLIQLCLASRQEILLRLNNLDRYFPLFDSLLQGLVARPAELQLLRETLNRFLALYQPTTAAVVATSYASWRDARQALAATLGGSRTASILATSQQMHGAAETDATIMALPGGGYGVCDRSGRTWTIEQLDQAIAIANKTAQAIDPLVGKIADLPQVVYLAKVDPAMAKEYLGSLLREMLSDNTDVVRDAEDSAEWAFRRSKIREDIKNRSVPGMSYALGGIHLLAHEAIGDSFMGDLRYAGGLRLVFGIEEGRQGLIAFLEFTGVTLLSVICPPLGAAAGLMIAGVHLHAAREEMKVVGGLLDNDQVLSQADAELDLFLAELESVFAIIPMAGKVLRLGGRFAAGTVRAGVGAGARRAARGLAKDVAEEMAAQLKNGLAHAFVLELVQGQIMGQIVEYAITPVIVQLEQELVLLEGAASPDGAPTPSAAALESASIDLRRMLDEEGAAGTQPSEGAEAARDGNP